MKQKVLASVLAAFVALVATSSAFAFECYNTQRSERGNQSAAGSSALMSIEEILGDPEVVGLCPAGVDHVIEGLNEAGFRTDVLINFHSLMAGGLEKNGKEAKLHDGKGIDHLSDAFFAAADPLIGEGFGICAGD
jgi:hypothetical protein